MFPIIPFLSKNNAGISGFWGVLAIGIFADNPVPLNTTSGRSGVLKGTHNKLKLNIYMHMVHHVYYTSFKHKIIYHAEI